MALGHVTKVDIIFQSPGRSVTLFQNNDRFQGSFNLPYLNLKWSIISRLPQ